jgi:DNA-binding transcriptional LysR family regulator
MAAFCHVVERHSFGVAGRALGMTGSAVSKLVAQLESDLGVRLLHRTTRSVGVSAEGASFYEAARRILDDIETAAEAVRTETSAPAGRLKVSVPTSFALRWMATRVPGFVARYPAVQLDLVLNDRYVDIVQEGFDCALRIAAQLPDSSLVARVLGRVERWLVAAPAYLEGAPPLRRPQDLQTHACLVYSQAGGPVEWALRGAAPVVADGDVRVNNSVMLRELLLAGLGVTLTPSFVVDDLVASGSLLELLPQYRPAPLSVWGVVAHPRYIPAKVKAFLDFIQQELDGKPVAE